MRCKQRYAFRILEKSVPPSLYSKYFHCNHILSKEDGSSALPLLALPKGSNLTQIWKSKNKLKHQIKNFNLKYTFKDTEFL